VLEELGCDRKPTVTVFNKLDLLTDKTNLHVLSQRFDDHAVCSALTGEGLHSLDAKVLEVMEREMVETHLSIPAAEGKLLHYLYDGGDVLSHRIADGRHALHLRLKPARLAKAQSMCPDLKTEAGAHSSLDDQVLA